MSQDALQARSSIPAPASVVFAVLADPANHAAIDGTGWVREPLEGAVIDHEGQVFGMAMYHDNHPDKSYTMHNRVTVFTEPTALSWTPGQFGESGDLEFGGWFYRYDLAESTGRTQVTLTYDWSAVPDFIRQHIGFPPFPVSHLQNSLAHLSELTLAKG